MLLGYADDAGGVGWHLVRPLAVEAGRLAFEAKLARSGHVASASSPLTAFLDEL